MEFRYCFLTVCAAVLLGRSFFDIVHVRFATLPQTTIRSFDDSKPTAEIAEALQADGVIIIANRVSKATIDSAYAELKAERMAEGRQPKWGVHTQLPKWPLDDTKEPTTKSLAADPMVMEIVEKVRAVDGKGSSGFLNYEVRLLIVSGGDDTGSLHRDEIDTSPLPLNPPLRWGLNVIWAASDFTGENGATRFVRGSHSNRWPQGTWAADHHEADLLSQPAVMPAGSVVLYYGNVLHGSGIAPSAGNRIGINFNYALVSAADGRPMGCFDSDSVLADDCP